MCHFVWRDSSAIKFDRVKITFISAWFFWLRPLTDQTCYLTQSQYTTSSKPVLAMTLSLKHQAYSKAATRVPGFKSLVWLDWVKWGSIPHSLSLPVSRKIPYHWVNQLVWSFESISLSWWVQCKCSLFLSLWQLSLLYCMHMNAFIHISFMCNVYMWTTFQAVMFTWYCLPCAVIKVYIVLVIKYLAYYNDDNNNILSSCGRCGLKAAAAVIRITTILPLK